MRIHTSDPGGPKTSGSGFGTLVSVCKLIHDDRPLIRLGCYLSFAPGAAAFVHQQNGNPTIIAKKV
jgi:hypothetical protein